MAVISITRLFSAYWQSWVQVFPTTTPPVPGTVVCLASGIQETHDVHPQLQQSARRSLIGLDQLARDTSPASTKAYLTVRSALSTHRQGYLAILAGSVASLRADKVSKAPKPPQTLRIAE